MSQNVTTLAGSPFNPAYIEDDRSHLYVSYDIDPAHDDGFVHPESGALAAPPDYSARRRAVVSFYGERCGRCGGAVAATSPDDEESLAHVLSLGEYDDSLERWALSSLVPLCQPCFDVIDAGDPDALGGINNAYDRAPQFPSWVCDPRVAVERIPLTGKEVWRREQLEDRLDREPFDYEVNCPVATASNLALETNAARAVALGEAYVHDRTQREPPTRIDDRYEDLDATTREQYEQTTRCPRNVLSTTGNADPIAETEPLPVGTAVDAASD